MGQQHSRRSRSLSGSQRSRLGSSERSRERGGLSRTKSVHENLVRERGKKVLIEDVYEVVGKIGHGALCEIYKLQKNKDKIGGSSRPELQRKKVLDFGRFLSYNDTMKLRKEESFQLNPLYFALKVINLKKVKEDKIDQLKNEIELLRTMDHMNIIKAYETFQDKASKKLMIVMELCTGGDLYERLPYSEEQAATIAKQILSAVSYMHQRNIIHRDIKMENVIYESKQPDALIKLIDFGLSKEYDSSQKDLFSERVGTLYSMSPETMKGAYDEKADLWSIGVCIYILLAAGHKPFDGKDPKELVQKVLKADYNFESPESWNSISLMAKTFINSLLVVDPAKRPSAKKACNHEWIRSFAVVEHASDDLKRSVRKALIRYANFGSFRRLALNVIAKRSTSDEIFHLRKVFQEFDMLNTGTLTLRVFEGALLSLNVSSEEIAKIFKSLDVNRNDAVNFTEFLAACLEAQGDLAEYRIAEAFDLLDFDDTGYITRDNLRKLLGGYSSENYIDRLLAEAGSNGKISYKDFLNVFADQMPRRRS
ncbi:hypothetical protein FisN_10Hh048 [Fistulifera solaris]|uniref:Uncharacterized protein n=1 Tax=Fistulifera solaris TaxID=1519565 RepID=A0A1Z5K5H3_FISSO|nr:hypothetical protein FisN_10Hh048 [Fistulifera solaris]|eukprot:GAX21469.1 hypothetical protein FisN_10Hh048 [Fistulifera solaris]